MAMARVALLLALAGVAIGADVLINAGGPQLPTIGWRADTAAYASTGSSAFAGGGPVTATGTWAPVYNTHRWAGTGDLEFKIPVPAGNFGVALMFAETWTGSGAGVRQMVVKINGAPVTQAGPGGLLDVFGKAGGFNLPVYVNAGNKASVGGFITVTLERVAGKNNPMISGIVIQGATADQLVGNEGLGGGGGGPGPAPIVTPAATPAPSTVPGPPAPPTPPIGGATCPEATTTTGKLGANGFVMNVGGPAIPNISWGADNTNYIVEGFKGSKITSTVPVPVPGTWGAPYLTYRWSSAPSLTYKIPIPAGTYQVNLLHAESFVTAAGQRTFGISINGDVKETAYDVFALAAGQHKAVYKSYNGIQSVGGFITIALTKGVENPFVNGIYINGPGAGSLAIGGPEDGSCTAGGGGGAPGGGSPVAGASASPKPDEGFAEPHFAHSVAGGPYVATDFDKDGKATVALDGSNSHSHANEGTTVGVIVKFAWTWTDTTNPAADANGLVTVTTKTASVAFPIGTTTISLAVEDQFGNTAAETTTVDVVSSTIAGAYCYKYNLGSANPNTVTLPVNIKADPKPNKAANVGDINFGNTAAFDVPFAANAFSVRCVYAIDLPAATTLAYKVVHTGPVKIYHNGVLQASSNSLAANTVTNIPSKAFSAGLQNWQIHYLRKPATAGKLILQDASGAVLSGETVRHDASTTLPVIVGLGKSSTAPSGGEVIGVFGSAFVNQVSIFFGAAEATTSDVTAGEIQVITPPGTGTVLITVVTAAGTSNGVPFTYSETDIPIKFVEDYVDTTAGAKAPLQSIATAIYGPDFRLYLGAINSKVYALTLNKAVQITKTCEANVQDQFPRTVLGLAFNPKSNALKLHMSTSTIFWQDKNQFTSFAAGWTNGKVETITMAGPNGCFNNDRADLITGLPVSNHDHAVNALEFLPSGELLIGIGGFTNGGISVVGDNLGGVGSNPLAGAIITCPAGGTAMTYTTPNNPVTSKIASGACKTWATGFRNSYGMDYHTNRNLYATDNGPNQGFGLFSTDCVGGSKPDKNIPDQLHKVAKGQCHGFPSINRGECVHEDPKCVAPLLSNLQPSTNGVLEYRSNTFQGKIKGNLFLSKFAVNGNGKLSRVQLTPTGEIKQNGFTNFFFGKSGLAIAEGPRGEMVMPRVQQGEVLVLKPNYTPPDTTTLISVMPRRGPATGGATVLLTGHNFGNSPSATFDGKPCTNVNVIDTDTFTCVTPTGVSDTQVSVAVEGSAGVSFSPGTDYWYF